MSQKWGQNFLVDEGIAARIIAESGLCQGDSVVEIGPGRGVLTGRLAAVAGELVAVEIDTGLCNKDRKSVV